MSEPLVSVVLTSYNQGEWLQESIESVLAQTMSDWELVLIDNGSTDHSMEIVKQYERHPKITIIRHEQNKPHTVILNHGIRTARGRYFSLLVSDDYYLPQKLERQVAVFEDLPEDYGVVYSNGYRLKTDGSLMLDPCGQHRGNVLEALLTEPAFFLPIAPLVRRECLLEIPFDETIFMEGEGIYTKLALRYMFHPLPEPLVVMREHKRNVGKEIESNLRRCVLMYERLFARPDFPAELRHLRGPAISGTYRIGGWQAIRRERRYRAGRQWLLSAIRHDSRALLNPRIAAGLLVSSLPKSLADRCMDRLDRAIGAPPVPVAGPQTPVEGYATARTVDAGNASEKAS